MRLHKLQPALGNQLGLRYPNKFSWNEGAWQHWKVPLLMLSRNSKRVSSGSAELLSKKENSIRSSSPPRKPNAKSIQFKKSSTPPPWKQLIETTMRPTSVETKLLN